MKSNFAEPSLKLISVAAVLGIAMFLPNEVAAGISSFLSEGTGAQSGAASARQISAGSTTTCATTSAGGLKCWGGNGNGQLGDGTTITRSVPVDVYGLSLNVASVSTGGLPNSTGHTCAVTSWGGAKCWGWNKWGQLGNASNNNFYVTPVDVHGLASGVSEVRTGGEHTCALMSYGGVKCWGDNYYGELGNGTASDASMPVDVLGLTSGVRAISTGIHHTCAVLFDGTIRCWGLNSWGQLGIGTRGNTVNVPTTVSGVTGAVSVSAGSEHTCALMSNGEVKCWGDNFYGELGNGTSNDSYTAVSVTGLSSGVVALASGEHHTCALLSYGGVKCWGWNSFGQIGNGSHGDSLNVPVDVNGLSSGVVGIAAGGIHSCALLANGVVKCWGDNFYGELGDGTWNDSYVPVYVSGFTGDNPPPTPTPVPPPFYFYRAYLPSITK